MRRNFSDEIDIELTKRDAQEYANENGIEVFKTVIMVPNCSCNSGLDDSTAVLKCPICGKPGVKGEPE